MNTMNTILRESQSDQQVTIAGVNDKLGSRMVLPSDKFLDFMNSVSIDPDGDCLIMTIEIKGSDTDEQFTAGSAVRIPTTILCSATPYNVFKTINCLYVHFDINDDCNTDSITVSSGTAALLANLIKGAGMIPLNYEGSDIDYVVSLIIDRRLSLIFSRIMQS